MLAQYPKILVISLFLLLHSSRLKGLPTKQVEPDLRDEVVQDYLPEEKSEVKAGDEVSNGALVAQTAPEEKSLGLKQQSDKETPESSETHAASENADPLVPSAIYQKKIKTKMNPQNPSMMEIITEDILISASPPWKPKLSLQRKPEIDYSMPMPEDPPVLPIPFLRIQPPSMSSSTRGPVEMIPKDDIMLPPFLQAFLLQPSPMSSTTSRPIAEDPQMLHSFLQSLLIQPPFLSSSTRRPEVIRKPEQVPVIIPAFKIFPSSDDQGLLIIGKPSVQSDAGFKKDEKKVEKFSQALPSNKTSSDFRDFIMTGLIKDIGDRMVISVIASKGSPAESNPELEIFPGANLQNGKLNFFDRPRAIGELKKLINIRAKEFVQGRKYPIRDNPPYPASPTATLFTSYPETCDGAPVGCIRCSNIQPYSCSVGNGLQGPCWDVCPTDCDKSQCVKCRRTCKIY